jgi:hypothetical protein
MQSQTKATGRPATGMTTALGSFPVFRPWERSLQVGDDGVRRDLAPMLVIETGPLQRLAGIIAPF